jgi:hypothetical protein
VPVNRGSVGSETMHYIVNSNRAYEGAPNLDPTTGRLKLPHGESLEEGIRTGWKRIVVMPGDVPPARKQRTEDAFASRRRRQRHA